MSEQDIQRWRNKALALSPDDVKPAGMPIETYLLEGEGLAGFIERYWEKDEDKGVPGLSEVGNRFDRSVGEEMTSLVRASRTAHMKVLFPEDAGKDTAEAVERAQFVVSELADACEYVLDDGVEEPADLALAEADERAEDDSRASLIQSLVNYAGVADSIKDRFADLSTFDVSFIDEARRLANEIGAEGPPQPGRPASPHIDLRDRLLTLLGQRMRSTRATARYVFRHHPKIVRKATSAYKRRRRLAARRMAEEAEAGSGETS